MICVVCNSFITLTDKKVSVNIWSESAGRIVCIDCYNNLSLCSKCNQQNFNEINRQCVVCDYVYCDRCDKKISREKCCSDCDLIDNLSAIGFLVLGIFLSVNGFKFFSTLSLVLFLSVSDKHIRRISELIVHIIIKICISVREVVVVSLTRFRKNFLETHDKLS